MSTKEPVIVHVVRSTEGHTFVFKDKSIAKVWAKHVEGVLTSGPILESCNQASDYRYLYDRKLLQRRRRRTGSSIIDEY